MALLDISVSMSLSSRYFDPQALSLGAGFGEENVELDSSCVEVRMGKKDLSL